MMYSVPSHIVQKVTDYAHRKAEFYFRDYLEEFLMSSITENDAFHHYRNEFYEAIFNVLDGNDRNWEVSCLAPSLPLAGLALALKRRGYADNSISLAPLHLKVTVNGLDFSFKVRNEGNFIEVGDFIRFKVQVWKESCLDFLEVLEQQSRLENSREHFEKIMFAYHRTRVAKDITSNAAHKIVEKVLDGEEYQIMLTGVNDGIVTFWIYTRWGEIRINSPFESFEEALTRTIDELREAEANDGI